MTQSHVELLEKQLQTANLRISELQSTVSRQVLMCISPVDGRYSRFTKVLAPIASEFGLIKYRVEVMVRYAIDVTELLSPKIGLSPIPKEPLIGLVETFDAQDAELIKKLETKGIKAGEMQGWEEIAALNHDVKACEVWLRHMFEILGLSEYVEYIHFGCTSEDVNNMAYGLMFRDMLKVTLPPLLNMVGLVDTMAQKYAALAMLAKTHGQPATPTTLGKELSVFSTRLAKKIKKLSGFKFSLKLNGASGNYAAMYAAYPNINWPAFAKRFIEEQLPSGTHLRFVQNKVTTQIEPHDVYVEFLQLFHQINTILVGFCQDIWQYISDDWLVQIALAGEVGSSTMPHKVNPINFENGEGNLLIAAWLIEGCCRKLPISRRQRDLSDSTVERVFGTIFAHSIVAYENIAAGMKKISANQNKIAEVLASHPEVLTEAYMTILRSMRYPGAYDVVKHISRGKHITLEGLHAFVDSLDPKIINLAERTRMKELRPSTYSGIARKLVTRIAA